MNQFRKTILSPVVALLVSSSAFADNITYSLEKQSLKDAIEKISKKANKPYITNGAILDGKTANAIKDLNGTQNALDEVLKNSGLEAIIEDGAIIIKPVSFVKVLSNGTYVLDDVSVNSSSSKNGSEESGYLVGETKSLGVWGDLSLQDTPYSMSIMSAELMENMGITDIKGVTRANPVLQDRGYQDIYGGMDANIRGFRSYNTLIDGSPVASFSVAPNEEADRVEVISGFSGFLYGGGNVGGAVNYILKRPTATQMNKITVGNNGGENYYTSFDSGGPINDKWGYRVSGIYQDGETSQENRKEEKKVITGAVDYKATDDLLLQIFASHRDTLTTGQRPIWLITGNMPSAYDTSKSYSPEWGWMDHKSDKVELSAKYNFSQNWSLRTAYIYQESEYENQQFINRVNTNTNTYTRSVYFQTPLNHKDSGGYAYLDGSFSTGFINHNLTLGASVHKRNINTTNPSRITYNDPKSYSSVDDFNTLNKVPYTKPSTKFRSSEVSNKNILLGDNISFTEQLSALVGVNLAYLKTDTFNVNGVRTSGYDDKALSPTLSLIYKPIENLTTYVTYIEALENGQTVGSKYNNYNEIFSPYISKQYEIGAKYSVNENLLLSTAIFRIEKKNSYEDKTTKPLPTLTQDGLLIHEGIELLATGKVTDRLTVSGGVTYLKPTVEKATNKALEGKKATETSLEMAKMFAEYRLPIEPKIFLNGGVYYTGWAWLDSANTSKLPSYTLYDSGIRYETKLDGYDTTFRINVANLTDEDYWVSANSLGTPRTVSFSATLKF